MPEGETPSGDGADVTTTETETETDTTVSNEETPPKFAGKYETDDAALQGVNEARKKLGLGEVETLYGDGGLYADRAAAERGYKDLTTLLRTAGKPSEADGQGMTLGDEPTAEEAVSPEQILQKASLSMADLETQYAEHGKLTDEQYKAIQKARPGLSREIIDTMADGMIAKASLVRQEQARMKAEAAEIVGGEDALSEMLKNAKSFVPADEFDDLQARIRDPKRFKGAVRDLKEFHAAAVGSGKAKPLAGGGAPPAEGGAKDSTDFARLMRLASSGDQAAIRKIRNTPDAKVREWAASATF